MDLPFSLSKPQRISAFFIKILFVVYLTAILYIFYRKTNRRFLRR